MFFLSAHILSGRVELNASELADYAWVTRSEMRDYVHPDYYAAIRDLL